jgi:iron complex outermembrane receptor protein
MKRILRATTALAMVIGSSPVFAQQAPQGPTTAGESEGLQDIVVTAQRREENLQRAAIAVSAISGAALRDQSITQATDLSRLVPAIQIAPAASFSQIYLRGVGTFGANAFAEQAVAFNLDGVYLSRSAAPAGLFFDLERIEVLKGPQGTLYGRNATGGAINVISAKPKLDTAEGYLNAEYGNYDTFKASGALNLPLGSQAAIRIAGQHAKHDGYFNDGYDDEDTQAVRGQVLVDAGGFDATLSADYAHVGGKGSGGTIMPLLFGDRDTRLGPSDPRVIAAYASRPPTAPVPQVVARGDGYQDNSFYGVAATLNADLGFARLTVLPAYRKTDLDFASYASSFLIDITEKSDQTSIEARLGNSSVPLTWVVGGYYFTEDVSARQFFDQASNGTRINSELSTDSIAAFGQATFSLTPAFRLTGGLRYTRDTKKQDTEAHSYPFAGFVPNRFPLVPIILDIPTFATSDVSFKKLTWKAGVEFDFGPASLLYASVATGFKSGALFSAIGRNYSDPENLTAFTVGSKNRFLDNRLQFNVEAFYWKYRDQQISHLAPVQVAATPGGAIFGPVFKTENAGKATIWGAEAELLWQASPADLLSINIQYLDTQYDDLRYQFYSTTGGPPVAGCAVTPTALLGASPTARIFDVDCSGRPITNAPKLAINAGYEHRFDLGGAGHLTVAADTRIESSRFVSIDYMPVTRQGSYMMSNARVTWEEAGGRFTIGAFVNNLENTRVFAASLQSPAKPGVFYNQLRPPRTYGLRAGIRF